MKIQIYPRKRKRKRKRERGENQLMWLAFAQLNGINRNLAPLKAALTNWSSLQFATLASAEMRTEVELTSFRRDAERRRS